MKNILISGISGFVGGNLEAYLNVKYKVLGLSRKENLENNVLSYNRLTNDDLNNCMAFIHLAGIAHDIKKAKSDKEYYKINTKLTITLFDKFLKSNCSIFIFLSSVKAAADKIEVPLTENINPEPITVYGKSKLKAEEYIQSHKLPDTKKVYILRPCMIHGPNNKGNLNLLYNFISKGVPYPLGKYENKRSFVSIENLCFVIEKIIEAHATSGVYNVADDEPISTNDLVRLIGREIDVPCRIINMPKWIIRGLAFLGDFIRLPFNTHRVDKLTENYVVSNKKIKEELKLDLPISTLEGLKKTIKSF